ncbi:hypothetical protein BDR03DRAFT_879419 [Suillus americanus]|nr:hypothetical protein BDR03DRAFT_879419 [Suillus americanus]
MGNRKISADLKFAAIRLHGQGILRLSEILNCVGFSRMTFYRIKKLYNNTGNIVKPRSQYTGCPHIFNLEDLHYINKTAQNMYDQVRACNTYMITYD